MAGFSPLYPKSDLTPLPLGANPSKWVDATDWNVVASGSYNIHNIIFYGAKSVADTTTTSLAVFDNAPAINAAIAAWNQNGTGAIFQDNGPTGGIYIPEGNWYIGSPIIVPKGCELFGDGYLLSNIVVGPGTPATPTLVQGFGGSMIAPTGINPSATPGVGLPEYTTPLIGATGRSLKLHPFNQLQPTLLPASIVVDDCFPWSGFLQWYAAQLCLRFWAEVTTVPTSASQQQTLFSSVGPNGAHAIGVSALSPDGVHVTFTAYLTTAGSGLQTIVSSQVAVSTIHHLEIDYNGSFFDFYMDGVNQGHLAATGRVNKLPWETVSIGDAGTEPYGLTLFAQPYGAIDSIEFAQIARHTGIGSFTPPVAKHTADANTLWLCNFDQGDPPVGQPFLYAQTVVQTISNYGFGNTPATVNAAITPLPPLGDLISTIVGCLVGP